LGVVDGHEPPYALGRRNVLELRSIRTEIYTSESRLIGLTSERPLADYALAAQMSALMSHFPRLAAAPKPS
jgi:hypothetical protein